jgi:hypothetical protein
MNLLDDQKQVILLLPVPGLHTGVVGAALLPCPTPSRLPALQLKQSACRVLMSSEPPWLLGMMGSTSRGC